MRHTRLSTEFAQDLMEVSAVLFRTFIRARLSYYGGAVAVVPLAAVSASEGRMASGCRHPGRLIAEIPGG